MASKIRILIPSAEEDEGEELEGFDDFTVATPWERFIAAVEGLLREWHSEGYVGLLQSGAAKPHEANPGMAYVEGEIPHGNKSFRLTLYFPEPENSGEGVELALAQGDNEKGKGKKGEKENPWESAAHPLQLWFGIQEFMVIAPMTLSGVVLDSPEASMLLSSLAIAASNADSSVPAFVPVHDPSRKAFVGFQHGPRNSLHGGSDYSCHFEADRLNAHVPPNLISLDGLYYLFAFKIIAELPSTVASVSPDVTVALRVRYRIRYWGPRGRPLGRMGSDDDVAEGQGRRLEKAGSAKERGGATGEAGEENGDEFWSAMEDRPWDENASWSHWHAVDDPAKGFEVIATWKELRASSSSGMAQIEQLDATWADEWRLRALLVPIEETSFEDDAPGFGGRLHAMLGAYVISSTAPYVEDFVQAQGMQRRGRGALTIPPPSVMERVIKDLFSSTEGSQPPQAEKATEKPGVEKAAAQSKGEKCGVPQSKLEPLRSLRMKEQQATRFPSSLSGKDATPDASPAPEMAQEEKTKEQSFVGKAAPADSLFGRLALHTLRFGTCNVRSICALWLEVCRELRWHWEEAKLLPSMLPIPGPPSIQACLIHQKLQLLQECIRRQQQQQQRDLEERMKQAEMMHRIAAAKLVGERVDELVRGTAFDDSRSIINSISDGEGSVISEDAGLSGRSPMWEGDSLAGGDNASDYDDSLGPSGSSHGPRPGSAHGQGTKADGSSESSGSGAGWSEDDRAQLALQRPQTPAYIREATQAPVVKGVRRQGAKGPAGDMWLLTVKRRMFVPHTQDPVYMTEDMIEEKEHAFEMLGESSAGREARARLQGDVLASDMSAFKAANPGAVLEDFVRWYSPQDWIDDDGSDSSAASSARSSPMPGYLEREEKGSSQWPPRGRLSERMQADEGNLWQELWEEAEAEPAHLQRPIFHFSLEGEKILHYFDTLVPEVLLSQLLCVAFSAAVHILGKADGANVGPVAAQRARVEAMIASMWQWPEDQAPGNCMDDRVEDLEVLFAAFEKMEASVVASASLWRHLQGCSRMVEELMRERAAGEDIPCVTLLAPKGKDKEKEATDEWEIVGNLFKERAPETGSSARKATWGGKRMGNLLLGHEPFEREVIFTSPAFAVYRGDGEGTPTNGGGTRGASPGLKKGKDGQSKGKGAPDVRVAPPGMEFIKHQLYAKGSLDDLSLALKIACQE